MVHKQLLVSSQNFSLTGPGMIVTDNISATEAFETFASNIVGVLTIIGALYFTIQIIFAGYAFISSQGDPKMMESARTRITEGILGLFIVVIALGLASLIANLLGIKEPLMIGNFFINQGLNQ